MLLHENSTIECGNCYYMVYLPKYQLYKPRASTVSRINPLNNKVSMQYLYIPTKFAKFVYPANSMVYTIVMKACIGYQSALEYWRHHRTFPNSGILKRRTIGLPKKPPTTEEVISSGLALPLHILISSADNHWISKYMRHHVLSANMPVGGFVGAEDGLNVSSPEFCYLQMAGQLTLIELIELGYELCGTYSLPTPDGTQTPELGFYKSPPLTSVKKLAAFFDSITGVKGMNKASAVRALRYIIDGSASPMETKLSILLTLPYRLGGFGLAKPEMNVRIVLSKTAAKSSDKSFYICDFFWPEHNLVVEYDSTRFHTGPQNIADDSKKRIALKMMDISVINITTQQLYKTIDFEKVVISLAKQTGKRLVYKLPDFFDAHYELRKQLLLD